jgi:pimeloyl-ACP methyl ester carboxylesterase
MDGVVLLHGIARRATSLRKMERALRAEGYLTFNLDYPSRRHSLQDIAEELHEPISQFASGIGRLHFVTHSMGGLVARAYLSRHRPENLGRVVMLAPPNAGSEVADLLRNNPIYRWFFGPAGAQLTTTGDAALHAVLGTVNYPLGIIAGDRTINLISSLVISGPDDGKVAVARTRVEGMADHIVLHTTHPLMMLNADVIGQTLHFLQHGRFERAGEPPSPVRVNNPILPR